MSAAIVTLKSYPPSANRIWRYSAHGPHRSTEYKDWLEASLWEIAVQKQPKVEGPFVCKLMIQKPARYGLDLDNYIKPAMDLVQKAGLIDNDKLAQKLTAEFVQGADYAVKIWLCSTGER